MMNSDPSSPGRRDALRALAAAALATTPMSALPLAIVVAFLFAVLQ